MDITTTTNKQVSVFNNDYYSSFLAYLDCSQKTLETYTRALKQWAKYLKDNAIEAPSRLDVLAYRDFLKTYCKPSTVQNYIVVVRLFFQWLETQGLYRDIAKHVKGAKVDHEHKKDYLTQTQIKQVLANVDRTTLKGARDYAVLCLMLSCGLRTVEVARACIDDIHTFGNVSVLSIQGKGHDEKGDFVILPSEVETVIRQYLTKRKCFDIHAPLFTSTSNNSSTTGAMTTRAISELVKTSLKASGFDSPRLTAHSLRHTAITQALLNGATVQEVQQFARHESINTTMIYSHNLEKLKNPCANLVANTIL